MAGLYYKNTRRSRGAVDDEKGYIANAVFYSNYVDSRFIPQVLGSFDFGVPLPLAHSSFWLRSAAGIARGEATDAYANFFFGGFGNNYVDANRPEKRYRQWDSLPGFEINELNGRRFARTMAEVNLPPYIFESVGTPAFFLAWLRPAGPAVVLPRELVRMSKLFCDEPASVSSLIEDEAVGSLTDVLAGRAGRRSPEDVTLDVAAQGGGVVERVAALHVYESAKEDPEVTRFQFEN
jgi:hypothetical protein